MFAAFLSRTNWTIIAGPIAEWRRHWRTQHQLMTLGEHERGGLPFSKDKTWAETSTQ